MSRLDLWREKLNATEEIELPSGPAVVRAHVTVLDLAAAGQIPTTLLTELDDLNRKTKGDPAKAGADLLTKIMPALDALVLAALVDPPVTRDGGADSLSLAEVPMVDKLALFARLNGAADTLRPFRGQEGQSDGASHSGNGVSPTSEPVTGD